MGRIRWEYTRSGISPTRISARPLPYVLPIAWYAPKPAWMTHIDGPSLRFGNRFAFEAHLRRRPTAGQKAA